MERPRKAPAIEKNIASIKEDDIRVRVIGTVKEVSENSFILEDETGSIKVESEQRVEKGSKIRVFGRPTMAGKELELSAEIIQDMSALDEKLYKKIESLKSKEVR